MEHWNILEVFTNFPRIYSIEIKINIIRPLSTLSLVLDNVSNSVSHHINATVLTIYSTVTINTIGQVKSEKTLLV